MHYHLCRHILAKKFIKKLAEISRCSLNIFVLDIFCVQIYLLYTFEKSSSNEGYLNQIRTQERMSLRQVVGKGDKFPNVHSTFLLGHIHLFFGMVSLLLFSLSICHIYVAFPFPFCFLLSFYKDNERLANYSRKLKIVNALTLPCCEQKVKTNAAFFLEYPYIHTWILT